MANKKTGLSSKSQILRKEAETIVKSKSFKTGFPLSETEMLRLIHELEVHKIELELQNQELREANEQAKVAAEKYAELYDFAPLGYFTLSREGRIIELNLNGAKMFGKERSLLLNSRFGFFISEETKPDFNLFIKKVFKSRSKETCELALVIDPTSTIYVHLTGIAIDNEEKCFVQMIDITDSKRIEETLLFLLTHDNLESKGNFFEVLARYLSKTLDMDYVCIDKLQGDLLSAQTVAIYFDGKFEDNVAYTLQDTPCGKVIGKTICCFPESVRHLFPKDIVLQEMLAESYIGTTLYGSTGQPIGLIALISRKPINNQHLTESILKLVAIRASGELERKFAEDELLNIASFPLLNPNPIMELDLDGRILFCNPAAKQIFPDIEQQGSCHPFFANWGSIIQKFKKSDSTNLTQEAPYKDRTFHQSILFVNETQHVRFYCADITYRKQMEEQLKLLNIELENRVTERTAELLKSNTALQQNEEIFRTVADFTYEWEYWMNPDGFFIYVSPSCERITGYTAMEFMADKDLIYKIIHPDDLNSFSNHVAQQFRSKHAMEIEFRIITKENNIRWIGHVCRTIFINGKYLGLRVSNRDNTEKVKAENELLNVTVEVEERERKHFSHELHDGLGPLLSTIKLYFQWLAETDDAEKIKIITEKGNNSIETAIQATREMAQGLSSLFLYDSGYVDAVVNFIQRINDTHQIAIDFTFNSRNRFSNYLEIILYRITTELINNTLKHAIATHAEIGFNINEKTGIDFTYIDNGIGFDLAGIQKTGKGTGLISIQQRIKILKGSFQIVTSNGKGLRVFVKLPFIQTINENKTIRLQKIIYEF